MQVNLVKKYFPSISEQQQERFNALYELYDLWNNQINVISRKDMDNFYERHVLHSLAIAKVIKFKPGSAVMDVGTGGGFPGIPLAIMFPETEFLLVDSIGKKIKVVNEVAQALGLNNVTGIHERAEKVKGEFDFIVSRAVTEMPEFLNWISYKFKKENKHDFQNGVFYLKGGDLSAELAPVKFNMELFDLTDFYNEPFFETKKIVYVNVNGGRKK